MQTLLQSLRSIKDVSTQGHNMTYSESFLSTCDAEGNVPHWAFMQIFDEHGSAVTDYTDTHPTNQMYNGQSILDWLGY